MKRKDRNKRKKNNSIYIMLNKYKDRNRKRKKKRYSKKQFAFSKRNYYSIINKIIYLLLLVFVILIIEKYKIIVHLVLNNVNKGIIESNYYQSFENIKSRYINDIFYNLYLEPIKVINHIYNKNYKVIKKKKNNIHICVSLNDKYIIPQFVSIESVLINCDKFKTFITYHIFCTPDVTIKTLSILKSLVYKYPFNLEMILYNMNSIFMKYSQYRISQAAFYRIVSPFIVDVDRIIHLDGDTLALKDLTKMYKMDLGDNYIIGYLDVLSDLVDYLGIYTKKYINDGVIILNSKKIRNDNKQVDLYNFLQKDPVLKSLDQTVINYVYYPKIELFPSEFVTWDFYDESDIRRYSSFLRTKVNITEMAVWLKNPTIIHGVLSWPKMWFPNCTFHTGFTTCRLRGNCSCGTYHNLWHFYANKTDFYEEIKQFTGIK